MKIELNHTIVNATDQRATADFLTDVLGLPEAEQSPPFLSVHLDQRRRALGDGNRSGCTPQHYAFLVGDGRVRRRVRSVIDRGITYFADPFQRRPGEINHDGGRGGRSTWLGPPAASWR